MESRCEAVDWMNWSITEIASKAFEYVVGFLTGFFMRRGKKRTSEDRIPLHIRGAYVGPGAIINGRVCGSK